MSKAQGSVMTNALMEWFMGRDADDLGWYNFTEARPVWKTWWFRAGSIIACIVLFWFFFLGR